MASVTVLSSADSGPKAGPGYRARSQKKLDSLRQRAATGQVMDVAKERATVGAYLAQWLAAIRGTAPTMRPLLPSVIW